MRVMKLALLVGFLALCACSEKNPNLCCVDAADCEAQGISMEDGTCADGLICRGNQCIAESCSTSAQCEAGAPYCTGAGLCAATCDMDSECPGFGQGADRPYCSMGACVECRTDDDCATNAPVCDSGSCRACALDTDCASGACGDNGACISPDSIVYVDPAGIDTGTCPKAAPCKTIKYALGNTLANRSHIVLASGTYPNSNIKIDGTVTTAPSFILHGHGATVQPTAQDDSVLFEIDTPAATIQDLKIVATQGAYGSAVFGTNVPVVLKRVSIDGNGTMTGMESGQNVTLQDVDLANVVLGLKLAPSSHILVDRVVIHGGKRGISGATTNAIVNISNLLIYDMSDYTMLLQSVTGSIQSSTIASTIASGSDGGTTGATADVWCTAGLTIQSSIIWSPGYSAINGPCSVSSSIVGPFAPDGGTMMTNVSTSDPMFKDVPHRDFHLTAGSPAIDKLDTGPMFDVEGTSRPQGVSFDYGAYEFKP